MNITKTITLSFISLFLSTGLIQAADYEATLNWSRRVELSFPVNGVVNKVYVQVGDKVAKQAALISLDERLFKAQQSEAAAMSNSAKEESIEAKRELDRALELYERTVLSEHSLQLAKNDHVKAKANYKQAQAAWTKAKMELNYSTMRAPFNAVVIQQKSEIGQTVRTDLQPPVLVVLGEAGKMLATSSLTERQIDGLTKGQAAKVTVKDKTYNGKIKNISLEAVDGHYQLDIEFPTGDTLLRAGLKATISL